MLIDKIVNFCDMNYNDKHCEDCSYGDNCPGRCDKCLHYIHSPQAAPALRKYDCPNMANYYVCKYSYKYMSEMVYALRRLKDLKTLNNIKVMSIGCGPCTELFALDYLKKKNEYEFEKIEYRGIDPLKKVWSSIHREIKNYDKNIYTNKFFYSDIFKLIDTILEVKWYPELIILQYVFSDMNKNCSKENIEIFIDKLAEFVNSKMEYNSYIVINDINLSKGLGGGREYFDILLSKINNCSFSRCHFRNSNKQSHYEYYEEYQTNELIIPIPDKVNTYEPFTTCASAQMIIKKVDQ